MNDPKHRLSTMYDTVAAEHSDDYLSILKSRELTIDNQTIKFDFEQFGTRPVTGFSLFIGLPPKGDSIAHNKTVWEIYRKQYKMPEGSIWLVPLTPNLNLNVWYEAYIDKVIIELIACFNSNKIINPNRVYLAGFSAGGDGVYKLAPRLAGLFAAAATMGGHPNGSSMLGLRNLPFSIQVGVNDNAYLRNKINKQYAEELRLMHEKDCNGYINDFKMFNTGHILKQKDTHAFKWMHQFERNPYPDYIVWKQCNENPQQYFYYLKVEQPLKSSHLTCLKKDNTFTIESKDVKSVIIRLNDYFVNLDQPIIVKYNGNAVFEGMVVRDWGLVRKTLAERLDPCYAFCAELKVSSSL